MTRHRHSLKGRGVRLTGLGLVASLLSGFASAVALADAGAVAGRVTPEQPQCHSLTIGAAPLLLTLRTGRVPATVELRQGGEAPRRFRSPVQDLAPERLLETAPPGALTVCIVALGESRVEGDYALEWRPFPASIPGSEALFAETRAAEAAAGDTPEDWGRAAAGYDEAAELWDELEAPDEAAAARFRGGEMWLKLEQPSAAETRFDRALADLGGPAEDDATRRMAAGLRIARGLARIDLGRHDEARTDFEAARALARAAGDLDREAESINDIALSYHFLGDLDAALATYKEALGVSLSPPNLEFSARVSNNIGGISYIRGDAGEALRYFGAAYEAHEAIGNRSGQMSVAFNTASLYRLIGEWDDALRHYDKARLLALELHDRRMEARTLSGIGRTYEALGRGDRARVFLRRALRLRRAVEDPKGEASTLTALGESYLAARQLGAARDAYATALRIRRELEDRPRSTGPLLGLAEVARLEGESAVAHEHAVEAMAAARDAGRRRDEAGAIYELGQIAVLEGEIEEALVRFEAALQLGSEVRDPGVVTAARVSATRLALDRGDLESAQAWIGEALADIESLRARIAAPALRATFLGVQDAAYELQVDLYLTRARDDPDGPWIERALETVERRRARMMRELLRERQSDLATFRDADRQSRRRELQRKARAISGRLARAPAPDPALEARLADVLVEIDALESAARRDDPRYARLTAPDDGWTTELQTALGPDEAVLAYDLGADRARVFALSRKRLRVYDLPPTADIERALRAFYEAVSGLDAGGPGTERSLAAELSEMLLAPVADFLEAKSLAIVPDGALHYLPFGALPLPGTRAPLVTERIVVQPASAALLRQHADAGPLTANATIAVLADPVFSPDDPRLGGTLHAQRVVAPPRGATPALPRLSATAREADALAALFPPNRRLIATGLDANRELVTGGHLASYSVLHFATHGLFDSDYPLLSGITLSRVGANLQPIDGFVGIYDAHGLELSADLVVLSGCETALGRELKAEGLVGLTHGFLYAGVPRVVASLWRVPERATAELMAAFYEGLVIRRETPAAALAAAQTHLIESRRWRDPYYWAGFTLQGTW